MNGVHCLIYWVAWNLAPGAGPESYLGVHTAIPAFGEDDGGGDPDLAPGLSITMVVENSPAAAAGLQAGDRVLRVNGETPRNPQHLEALVAVLLPGSELNIAARRGGEMLDLTARTVPRVEPRKAPEVRQLVEGRRLGLALITLTAEECERAGIVLGDGVRVRRLLAGGPAEGSGLQPGDVIITVNGDLVHGGDDFLALAGGLAPKEKAALTISREGQLSQIELVAREPDGYVSYFHFPGIVIYENEPRKQETTFGVILNIFKYTRKENRRTYRFLWIISFSTGTNEELQEVAE